MMNIHLFGSTSLTGITYQKLIKELGDYNKVFSYSSSKKSKFFLKNRQKEIKVN